MSRLVSGVPYTFELIEQGRFELPSSVRYVTMSGGHSPVDRVRRWVARGKKEHFEVFSMYGSTEATSRMTYVPPTMLESAPEAIGIAMPGGQIRLEHVPEAEGVGVGEIVYSGDNVMMGYASSAEDLAEGALLDELRSGDLARLGVTVSTAGWVAAAGSPRSSGCASTSVHLEQTARIARGVQAACVDAKPGVAVFVTSGERVLDAVSEISGLPRHAIAVRTVDELPMTTVGKVDYGRLRTLADEPEARTSEAFGAPQI